MEADPAPRWQTPAVRMEADPAVVRMEEVSSLGLPRWQTPAVRMEADPTMVRMEAEPGAQVPRR